MMKFARASLAAIALLAGWPAIEAAAAPRTQLYAPRNDQFANAYDLAASKRLTLGRLIDASREAGEPKAAANSIGRTVWYRYKSTLNGRAVVALTTGRLPLAPLKVAVYKGSKLTALTRIGTAALSGTETGKAGAVAFDTTAGQVFHIQVDTGPQSGFPLAGGFEIGVDQFGPTGGVALFDDRPQILQEGIFGPSSYFGAVLVASAFPGKVNIKGEPFPTKAYRVSTSAKSLKAGQTAWVEVKDDPDFTLPGAGSYPQMLKVVARDPSTNAVRSTLTRPVHLLRSDNGEAGIPSLLLRYEHNMQGVLDTRPFTSKAYVRNLSGAKAFGCRFFVDQQYGMTSLTYSELGSTGVVMQDEPFDLAPGKERTFAVTGAGTTSPPSTNRGTIGFACSNSVTQISGDALSYMSYEGDFGLLVNLVISTTADNVYKQIAMAPFKTRTVVMSFKNTGEYSGDFDVSYSDDSYEQRADVVSMCESGKSGSCIGPTITDPGLTLNIAPGETSYIAMKVARGGDNQAGIVELQVLSRGREGSWMAGLGGFEVVPK